MTKLKQQSNVLLLRMLFLLAMVLTGSSASWGQTSLGKMEFTSYPSNGSDGRFWLYGNDNFTAGCNGLTTETATKSDKFLIKLGEDGYFELNFNEGVIKAGDILKVECGCIYGDGTPALGFIVNGHTTSATPSSNSEVLALQYTIQASDFMDGTDGKKKIQIKRNAYTTGYHSIEVLQSQKFTVSVNRAGLPSGCDAYFTIGSDATHYTTAQSVPVGTQVTYTMTSSDAHYTPSGWRTKAWEQPDYGWMGYTASFTTTVRSAAAGTGTNEQRLYGNLNPTPEFNKFFFVKAVAETGGTATVTDASGHNTSERYDNTTGELTFTATPNAGYTFDGWYNTSGTKVGTTATWNSGTYGTKNSDVDLVYTAKFKANGAVTHPASIDCVNNTIDLSKITVASGATYNPSTHQGSITANYGTISVKFSEPIDLHELSSLTIAGTNVEKTGNAGAFNGASFKYDGGDFTTFNYPFSVSNPNDAQKEGLKKVTEITLFGDDANHKGDFTLSSITLNFGGSHAAKATPTLTNGTTSEMVIFEGESLTITNTPGYWREFTDANYNSEVTTRINAEKGNLYERTHTFENLPIGEYYFAAQDATWCSWNHKHGSELVKIHVSVKAPINSVDVNGTNRQYDVYAPAGITGKVGVVISLHGASNDYDNGRVDFNGIAETEKNVEGKRFIVVYPRGLMRQLRGTERGWDSYTENGTEDVDFFKEIVKELKKTYTVDDNRIYLAGFSNGGMMAYKAAHQAGDFFAAFASVGGFPVNESHLWHAGKQPTPFIHIQGEADTVFPSATYDVNTIIHNMVYRNGAQFNPWDTSDGRVSQDGNMISENNNSGTKVVTKDCHSAEAGGADYFFYKIKGMGHTWSYNWDGVEGEDIASTMWEFFNKANKVKSLDKTLKFRIYDETSFMDNAKTCGFDVVNEDKTVIAYGKNKTNDDKNIYHSLQFAGTGSGTPHYLRLNMETEVVANSTDYFLVSLTKYGDSNPVFAKRYQAGKGKKDLYINFTAPNGVNEYRLVVTKSRSDLDVKVNRVEFHSGMCEDNPGIEENDVYFTDIRTLLGISDDPAQRKLNPIYQPVYGQSYNSLAKEYLPIAKITVPTIEDPDKDPDRDSRTINDVLKYTNNGQTGATTIISIAGSTTSDDSESKIYVNIANSPKDTNNSSIKSKTAVILGNSSTDQYPIDEAEGINISHYGRAMMPEYINGTVGDFPSHGVIAMQMQGTLDFTVLAKNVNTTAANRRVLRVYYTNDQLNSEIRELKEWDFYGTRNELGTTYGQQLSYSIRMQHLGQDGTCVVFVTYEGRKEYNVLNDYDEDHDDVWIKGIVIKRPDLDVTIGRTDKLRYKNDAPINSKNDKLTCFGENKPYQWNFGTSAFNNTKKTDIDKKKENKYDGRTYICGVGPNGEQLIDHLLVYSDGAGDDKATFDGRPSNGRHKGFEDDLTDNNEHIEFNHPTKYSGTNTQGAIQNGFDKDRRSFNPILSNGLKVNVTGSGWFTIACSAPNGAVNMKVLSSTNGGNAFINLLREFRVEKSDDPKPETDWQTYRVYLKAHAERDGNEGFWDGNEIGTLDPEDTQMSLYVVFDAINGVDYKDNGVAADPQLNIHYLQWLNEMPADYVFQREENPALLNSRQSIKNDGTNEKPALYWQAGTTLVEDKKSSTSKTTDYVASAYNSAGYQDRESGERSEEGYITSSRDDLACEWNVAAYAHSAAHTEVAYKNGGKNYGNNTTNVYSTGQANGPISDQNLEFAIPISGSFFRFMPMKNEFISAWIVPAPDKDGDNEKTETIYVLDETGKPIPYILDADMQDANKSKVTADARIHGWVKNISNGLAGNSDTPAVFTTQKNGGKTAAVRIDFAALAGKEYFIVSDNGTISLARLNVTGNEALAAVEEINNPSDFSLKDNTNNSTAINNAMNGTGRYVKSVTLNRTFGEGKWASLVLPFSMNEEKFKRVFGENAKCIHFTDVNMETNTVKLTHHFYNMIVAGRPVFIYTPDEVKNPVITDVTLQAATVTETKTQSGLKFVGSYDNAHMDNLDFYLNNNNEFKYLAKAEGATYPGLRSWIKNGVYNPSTGAQNSSAPVAMFLNFDDAEDGEATGIESIFAEEFGQNAIVVTKSTKVYDLNGRVVANGTDISNLPSGVYIVNGKKYVK